MEKITNLRFLAGGSWSSCKWEDLESNFSRGSGAEGYRRQELQQVKSAVFCNTFRVSDGSVFTEDAGFKLILGQADDFPLLQVSQMS